MTRAADCCAQMLKLLHGVEDKIEHENMLNPDPRLTDMEIALHRCIHEFETIAKMPRPPLNTSARMEFVRRGPDRRSDE